MHYNVRTESVKSSFTRCGCSAGDHLLWCIISWWPLDSDPLWARQHYSNEERKAGHLVISNSNKYWFGTIFIVPVMSSSRILPVMHSKKKKTKLQERRRRYDFCALVVPSLLWFVYLFWHWFFFSGCMLFTVDWNLPQSWAWKCVQ